MVIVQGIRIIANASTLCFNVKGYNFGGEFVVNNMSLLTVTVAGTPCLTVSDVNHTSLVCCSNVTNGVVLVTVAGQTSAANVLTNGVRISVPTMHRGVYMSSLTPAALGLQRCFVVVSQLAGRWRSLCDESADICLTSL